MPFRPSRYACLAHFVEASRRSWTAVDLDQASPYRGTATPFDTGGLLLRFIHSSLSSDHDALERFTHDSISQWQLWREAFASFLAAYFNPLQSYWDGRPGRSDPEEIFFNDKNSWRAWTVEVRLKEGTPILDATAWTSGKAALDHFLHALRNVDPAIRRQLLSFRHKLIFRDETNDPCGEMESWVKNRVGVP